MFIGRSQREGLKDAGKSVSRSDRAPALEFKEVITAPRAWHCRSAGEEGTSLCQLNYIDLKLPQAAQNCCSGWRLDPEVGRSPETKVSQPILSPRAYRKV